MPVLIVNTYFQSLLISLTLTKNIEIFRKLTKVQWKKIEHQEKLKSQGKTQGLGGACL